MTETTAPPPTNCKPLAAELRYPLPVPSPGAILRQKVAGYAEDFAVRMEGRITPESAEWAMPRGDTGPAWRESGTFTGAPNDAVLASTREDKSTSELYLDAIARVRDAFHVQEMQLTEAEQQFEGAWSVKGLARLRKLQAKLESARRRVRAFEACAEGKVCVHRFTCPCCGQLRDSPPLTCNQRTCPACVPKLRAQNIAKVLELLEAVDTRRQQRGQRTPRWRFLTLTVKSFDAFLPMRRFMAKVLGKLMKHRFWQKEVGAAVVCWETTHTAAGWHVHAHALIDAFLPRDQIVRAWSKVTGGLGQDVGVHISEPKGGRRAIARELAKYIAKDLGGAGADDSSAWGVAGNPHRLAEFMSGSFRWRTLRTYGDCYAVADVKKDGGHLTCDGCGVGFEYLGTVWLTHEELAEQRSARRDRTVPADGSATPAAP
jgi:hypothetical protein